jgi:hypothetical protein
MNSMLVKRLFSAIHTGKSEDIEAPCRRIIEDERKRGHSHIAEDLERIISARRNGTTDFAKQGSKTLSPLPLSKRDSAPLVHVIEHSHLRHHMVLPENVEGRLQVIEKEFAAKLRLDSTIRPAERNRIIQKLKCVDGEETKPSVSQRLLRRRDVAERLCLSLRTVDKLHKEGFLQKVRLPGRVRAAGFREEDVNNLLNA